MNLELDQKQVIVTGGSKGIGLAIALNFGRVGAMPVLVNLFGTTERVALGLGLDVPDGAVLTDALRREEGMR